MCIIVATSSGAKLPTLETLKACWGNNPDGAGFMWADGNVVHIRKGLMSWSAFEASWNAHLPELEGRSVVAHFRIATHGGISKKCCHPFLLTDKPEYLEATSIRGRVGIAHNGIITGMPTDKNTSDTMCYISDVLVPLYRQCGEWNADALSIINATCNGSRFAILDKTGTITRIGTWYISDGTYFSNSYGYKPATRHTYYHSSYYDSNPYTNPYMNPYTFWDDESLTDTELKQCGMWPICRDCECINDCLWSTPFCESETEARELLGTEAMPITDTLI